MNGAKENIINLFYNEHFKVKEIATQLKVSSAYITKIIKNDNRYTKEKNYRKEISKDKRKKAQNKFIKSKREQKRLDESFNIVQAQHIQASIELSKSKHLNNENFRKWNSSAYNYNPSKHRYEFNEQLGRAADVPKYIKER